MDSGLVSHFHLARAPPNPGIPAARAACGTEFRDVRRQRADRLSACLHKYEDLYERLADPPQGDLLLD